MDEIEINEPALADAFDRRAKRRAERRDFFKLAGGFAAGAAGTVALTACGGGHSSSSTAVAQSTGPSDADVLNFALNLEYLEANFYSYAAFGTPISSSLMSGTGTVGTITPGQKANLSTTLVQNYAKEIASEEINHVAFLRSALTTSAVAMPSLDVSAAGAFTTAAVAAGLLTQAQVSAGMTFNPYANDENFLLGSYIFEDVGVTAYHGAAMFLTDNKTYLDKAAGILAVEAYHAGLIRTALYALGLQSPAPAIDPFAATAAISKLRATLDGTQSTTPDDVGIGTAAASTIVPADSNSIAFDRTTAQVLNVVYGTASVATKGLFFPNGMNGNINTSG